MRTRKTPSRLRTQGRLERYLRRHPDKAKAPFIRYVVKGTL
jgi:hypothetical protein